MFLVYKRKSSGSAGSTTFPFIVSKQPTCNTVFGFHQFKPTMAGNVFGQMFRITTWGESHGRAVGVVVDGLPAGLPFSEADIQKELDRRRPGQSEVSTPRREADRVEILSGIFEGISTGTPVSMLQNRSRERKLYGKSLEANLFGMDFPNLMKKQPKEHIR